MTVNEAFADFIQNTVNLDSEVVKAARKSRDNLLDNISEFSEKDGFFNLYSEFNVQFGSFASKTKCRELDDIDMMIGISADGALTRPIGSGMIYKLLLPSRLKLSRIA